MSAPSLPANVGAFLCFPPVALACSSNMSSALSVAGDALGGVQLLSAVLLSAPPLVSVLSYSLPLLH